MPLFHPTDFLSEGGIHKTEGRSATQNNEAAGRPCAALSGVRARIRPLCPAAV